MLYAKHHRLPGWQEMMVMILRDLFHNGCKNIANGIKPPNFFFTRRVVPGGNYPAGKGYPIFAG
jgi:hypothetical protein